MQKFNAPWLIPILVMLGLSFQYSVAQAAETVYFGPCDENSQPVTKVEFKVNLQKQSVLWEVTNLKSGATYANSVEGCNVIDTDNWKCGGQADLSLGYPVIFPSTAMINGKFNADRGTPNLFPALKACFYRKNFLFGYTRVDH